MNYNDLTKQGYFLYWDMLGTICGIENNSKDGFRWLSGSIEFNYYVDTDCMDTDKLKDIVKHMKEKKLPNNLFFIINDKNLPDPRKPFMDTGMFEESWGNKLLARDLTDSFSLKIDKRLNIFRVNEVSQLKALGAINNIIAFGSSLFSFEQYLAMMNTKGLYFYLAEYDGLPAGMCMAQDGEGFVSLPWFNAPPNYCDCNLIEHLINAAERDAFLRGRTVSVMDTQMNDMLARLGYKEYAYTVQLVLK